LYGNDAGNFNESPQHQHQGMSHHGQSASISNGYPTTSSASSGAPTIGGLLAPSNPRGQHSRAVSLPAFAPQIGNGFHGQDGGVNGMASSGNGGGHRYQSSFSGLAGMGSGFGLAIQEQSGLGGVRIGLNGWTEEEAVQ
jgi:hypothetical protein